MEMHGKYCPQLSTTYVFLGWIHVPLFLACIVNAESSKL
jgi:hypothetical protein